jgi:hypothetical protein
MAPLWLLNLGKLQFSAGRRPVWLVYLLQFSSLSEHIQEGTSSPFKRRRNGSQQLFFEKKVI